MTLKRPPVAPQRVECVGPKCGLVVSMNTAQREGWRRIVESNGNKLSPPKERTAIGWCRACSDKYGVRP